MKLLLEKEYLLEEMIGKKISGIDLIYNCKKYDDIAIMFCLEDGSKIIVSGCSEKGSGFLSVERI